MINTQYRKATAVVVSNLKVYYDEAEEPKKAVQKQKNDLGALSHSIWV